jgi:predicted PurR-regulated permease PerM
MEASETLNDMDPKKVLSLLFNQPPGAGHPCVSQFVEVFFSYPCFWAAAILVIFKPLYDRFLVKLKRPNLGASRMLCVIALIILLPSGFNVCLLVTESMDIYNSISADAGAIEQEVRDTVSVLTNPPYVRPFNAESVCNSNVLVVN